MESNNGKCKASSVTPTLTPTPTVTQDNGDDDCVFDGPIVDGVHTQGPDDIICTTPTPTATPEATPTPSQGSQDTSSSGNGVQLPGTPICTAGDFHRPFGLTFVGSTEDHATFSWTKSADPDVDFQIAYIGLQNGVPVGSAKIDKNDQTITFNYVPRGAVWADIVAIKGDCSEETGWVDPFVKGKTK